MSDSELPIFDLSTLGNTAQRLLCENLIERGHEVYQSFAAAYLGGRGLPVQIVFRHSPFFNASAQADRDSHSINVHIASVLLLQVLFEKLLSSPEVVPELPGVAEETRTWTAPFIRDLGGATVDTEMTIRLDGKRHEVALVLQDFCAWFILLHEVSHLICGHCRGAAHFFGEKRLQEFFGLELLLNRGRFLKTSWEYDADITASAILCQYIRHFHSSRKNPHLIEAFEFLDGNLARLVGLVTASLFAMFVYLSQMEYRLKVKSYHPHPMLRTKYIAQALLRRSAADYGLDGDEIYEWQMEYMSQMAVELERIGLFDWDKFDAGFSSTDGRVAKLSAIAERLRKSCAKWSWFPLDRWETLGG